VRGGGGTPGPGGGGGLPDSLLPVAEREQTGSGERADWRLPIAAAALLLLGGVTGAVVLLGGGSGSGPVKPPPGCVEAWNTDREARTIGKHNLYAHGYRLAEVQLLDAAGEPADADDGGRCTVVFPARTLDPEPQAAAYAEEARGWVSLSNSGVPAVTLGELQSEAISDANVDLDRGGTLRPTPL
jgi:hypothetical protein